MSKAREIEIAKKNGWTRLGSFVIDTQVALTADEKVELGKEITAALGEITILEEQKKNYNDRIKGKIADQEERLQGLCMDFRGGVKSVEKEVPAFFDPRSNERHYVDLETGEIIRSAPAERDDAQMKIGA